MKWLPGKDDVNVFQLIWVVPPVVFLSGVLVLIMAQTYKERRRWRLNLSLDLESVVKLVMWEHDHFVCVASLFLHCPLISGPLLLQVHFRLLLHLKLLVHDLQIQACSDHAVYEGLVAALSMI